MTPSRWGPKAPVEHTFQNGKTATIRLPGIWQLIREGVIDQELAETYTRAAHGQADDPAKAQQLTDTLLVELFVDPKVTKDRERVDYEATPQTIHVDDIDDVIIGEILELAFAGVADAERFRGDADGADRSENGADLVDDAEPAARAARGKRGGVDGRRAAGGAGARGRAASR